MRQGEAASRHSDLYIVEPKVDDSPCIVRDQARVDTVGVSVSCRVIRLQLALTLLVT